MGRSKIRQAFRIDLLTRTSPYNEKASEATSSMHLSPREQHDVGDSILKATRKEGEKDGL